MGTIDIGGKGIILPLVFHEEYIKNIRNNRVFIEYKSDGSEYVFRCRPDRDTEIKIVPKDSAPAESAQAGAVPQGTRLAQACYDISPVCGLITSALPSFSRFLIISIWSLYTRCLFAIALMTAGYFLSIRRMSGSAALFFFR